MGTISSNSEHLKNLGEHLVSRMGDVEKIELHGHTSGPASKPYNNKLADQRAQSVKRFLLSLGYKESVIITKSFGEERLLQKENEKGRSSVEALNRRVEIRVELSKEYGFKIIEDASHAIGGRYLGESIGGCKYSDITVFSFHPVKIITTGEGGMALTNSPKLAERMSLLSSHGITRDPSQMTHESDGEWYYQQVDLGFNYRITEMQAALGLSQLDRLDYYVSRRHEFAARYNELLKDLQLVIPYQHDDGYSAFHLYIIRIKNQNKHKQVFKYLRKEGIAANLHYIPVHTQPYYQQTGVTFTDLTQAEEYYKGAISLPLYPTMTVAQQDFVISSLRKALQL